MPSLITLPWYLRARWPYLILASLCVLLYAVTASYGFSPLDEYWLIIREQERLSSFSNFPELFTDAPTLGMYYRPMLSLSFMIDSVLGGGSTMAFHIDNIVLHACCVLLLFYFLKQTGLSEAVAFFATLLFAVHPLHVHAVAWVPGRNDLILASFLLLSCIFLIAFLREGKRYKLALHFVFFALCLLTKESAILLPLIYAAIWWTFGPKKTSQLLINGAAWTACVAGFYFVRASVVQFMPVVEQAEAGERITDLLSTFFVYLGKVIVPVQQSVMPVLTNTTVWWFIVVVIAIVALFMKCGVRNKQLALLGVVWFCVLIAIPVYLGMANGTGECYEHRVYTPMIGLLILFSQLKINIAPRTLKATAMIVVCLFVIKAATRLPVYASGYSYMQAAVNEVPTSGQFHFLMGVEHEKRGEYALALEEYKQAADIDPGNAEYISKRGYMYGMQHDYPNALKDADRALLMDRGLSPVFLSRSRAYFGLGDYEKARINLDTAQWLGVPVSPGYEDSVTRALQNTLTVPQ
jgi:tetratricopeptide (TPR) repeat protein